jgi:aldose 1-epimerase
MADVVLGFDNLEGYLGGHPFFGAIIGRFGNRIAGGSFVLDGVRHSLPVNNAPNTLHGGTQGFDKKLWDAQIVNDGIKLSYISPDGEMGFPGTLRAEVTYTLSADNAIVIDYRASTDKPPSSTSPTIPTSTWLATTAATSSRSA